MEEGLEFLAAEVGEDLAVPVENGGVGLMGDPLHRGGGGGIIGDVDLAEADAVFGKKGTGLGAPGATGFDVEDGKFCGGHTEDDSPDRPRCGPGWAFFCVTGAERGGLNGMRYVLSKVGLWLVGIFFIVAGVYHFAQPAPYRAMMPPWLPQPDLLVVVSGLAEIAGGIGVLIERFRRMAAWGLIALLVAVFPANLQVALHGWPGTDFPHWFLWVRLPFQGLFIWLIYRSCLKTGTRRTGTPSEVEWPDVP